MLVLEPPFVGYVPPNPVIGQNIASLPQVLTFGLKLVKQTPKLKDTKSFIRRLPLHTRIPAGQP